MIRLYPQVVQSENNIQDLRRLLSDIHGENLQQCDQLTEAALRIRELGAELGKADFDKKDRLQDYKDAKDVAITQQARYAEQVRGCQTLRGELAKVEAMHERQLRNLMECELQSKQRWDSILQRQASQTQRSESLFEQRGEQQRLRRELAEAQERWRGLAADFGEAEARAQLQRDELREALHEAAAHDGQAQGLEGGCSDADAELGQLGTHKQGLAAQRAALGDVDAEYAVLREKVGGLALEAGALQDVLSVVEPRQANLVMKLEVGTEGLAVLGRLRDSEDKDLVELQHKLQVARGRNQQLMSALELEQRGGQEMKLRATDAAELAQQLENEQRGKLDKLTRACLELTEKVDALETNNAKVTDELVARREKNEVRQQKLKKISEEAKLLEAAKAEAERLLEREKSRCRCVVM